MKNIKITRIPVVLSLTATVLLLFCLTSCARKASFQTSSVVPAAKGTVKVKKDNNRNYTIKITLYDLAEPSRLLPPKNTYVVWMKTDDNGTKNIGQIMTSTGFWSSKLKANFETVSSFKPIKIFITAEDNADVTYPGMTVVLSTQNF